MHLNSNRRCNVSHAFRPHELPMWHYVILWTMPNTMHSRLSFSLFRSHFSRLFFSLCVCYFSSRTRIHNNNNNNDHHHEHFHWAICRLNCLLASDLFGFLGLNLNGLAAWMRIWALLIPGQQLILNTMDYRTNNIVLN